MNLDTLEKVPQYELIMDGKTYKYDPFLLAMSWMDEVPSWTVSAEGIDQFRKDLSRTLELERELTPQEAIEVMCDWTNFQKTHGESVKKVFARLASSTTTSESAGTPTEDSVQPNVGVSST